MIAPNPLEPLRQECHTILNSALKKTFPNTPPPQINLKPTPNLDHGQFATSLCFELAKTLTQNPQDLATQIVAAIDPTKFNLLTQVVPTGGYINFHVNFTKFTQLTLQTIQTLTTQYGAIKTNTPQTIIVEHTSVNPLHAIHIGQARNPIIGDTIARLLKHRGHTVSCHYYIDDVGRQSSVVAYGYSKLDPPPFTQKPDWIIGQIYTITSCLIEINRLKKTLTHPPSTQTPMELNKTQKELNEWTTIAEELKQKHPQLYTTLQTKINQDPNPEETINHLNQAYENNHPNAKTLIRKVSELCLEGFRTTLTRINITYDSWDWESDLVWTHQVTNILTKLKTTPYLTNENGTLQFNADQVAQTHNLKQHLGLNKTTKIPPLTLIRADGTTLYTTRDIAYTLWKFKHTTKVINVIGNEQTLAQLQLKLALYALNYPTQAKNLTHFAYNLVTLPGYKMSSRRGHYITLDEVLNEATQRAYQEVTKRSPNLTNEEKQHIATFVGIGAVRYALIDIDPNKPVTFTWERVLNFETNSAPYIQYTHARANSILRKAQTNPQPPNYTLLTQPIEKELILTLAKFPDTFIEATEYLKPNMIADYTNTLADKFNTYYNAHPVLKAPTQELTNTRLNLVNAIQIVIKNALTLIGVVAPEKM